MGRYFESQLKPYEQSIARSTHEIGYVFGFFGKLFPQFFKKVLPQKQNGDKIKVNFKDSHKAMSIFGVVTHNHAFNVAREFHGRTNQSVFSSEDVHFAYAYRMSQIRMVIDNERHIFKWKFTFRRPLSGNNNDIVFMLKLFERARKNYLERLNRDYNQHLVRMTNKRPRDTKESYEEILKTLSNDQSEELYKLYLGRFYDADDRYFKKVRTFLEDNKCQAMYRFEYNYCGNVV